MANIGKSITINGDLTGEEDLVIEGKVEGKVTLPNSVLTIGANGTIKAEVQAKSVVVIGRVVRQRARHRARRDPGHRHRRGRRDRAAAGRRRGRGRERLDPDDLEARRRGARAVPGSGRGAPSDGYRRLVRGSERPRTCSRWRWSPRSRPCWPRWSRFARSIRARSTTTSVGSWLPPNASLAARATAATGSMRIRPGLLALVPVAVARAVGAPPIAVFDGLVGSLFASLAAFHRILARGWPELAPDVRLALCGLLGAALTLLPGYEFGQREHLVVIAALPGSRRRARSRAGRSAGAPGSWWRAAGVGFAIKPFFLLAWVAVEALVFTARLSRLAARGDPRDRRDPCRLRGRLAFAREYAEVARPPGRCSTPTTIRGRLRIPRDPVLASRSWWPVIRPPRDRELRRVLAPPRRVLGRRVSERRGWSYHFLPADSARADRGLLGGPRARDRAPRARPPASCARGAALERPRAPREIARASSRALGRRRTGRDRARGAAGEPVLFLSTAVGPAFPVVNVAGAGGRRA